MCGIVGYVGARSAGTILVEGLRRLEYRGYDSAGVAYQGGERVVVRKGQGRLDAMGPPMIAAGEGAQVGIAHTRWATHGKPSDENSHPHTDCGGAIAVVHNGIVENYRALRERLAAAGHTFRSQTDTEVIPHLVEEQLASGLDLREAVRGALAQLKGTWAVAVVSAAHPGRILAARSGSPLVVGVADHGMLVASDVPALLPFTAQQLVLQDGEGVELSASGAALFSVWTNATVSRAAERVPWTPEQAERGGHPHFMLKEIEEQPHAVAETLRGRLDGSEARIPELGLDGAAAQAFDRVELVACGTSWHAAVVGARMLREFAGISASAEIASEHRFQTHHGAERTLVIAVSQSGETADTLAAVRAARERSARTVGVCNVVGSSLARECDGVLTTRAGPEISVASTKAFATQLAALGLITLQLGRARGALAGARADTFAEELARLPQRVARALALAQEACPAAARVFRGSTSALFLGRGYGFPLALEGALKLKEISYVHAEGHPAGEMKHGPIALIDPGLPVVGIVPSGALRDKLLANLEEVRAREGRLIVICPEGDTEARALADAVIEVPGGPEFATAAAVVTPLQLLAYLVAVERGCDVDKPRNLAKSVTVE